MNIGVRLLSIPARADFTCNCDFAKKIAGNKDPIIPTINIGNKCFFFKFFITLGRNGIKTINEIIRRYAPTSKYENFIKLFFINMKDEPQIMDKNNPVQSAIIFKEILDKPRSLRRKIR